LRRRRETVKASSRKKRKRISRNGALVGYHIRTERKKREGKRGGEKERSEKAPAQRKKRRGEDRI